MGLPGPGDRYAEEGAALIRGSTDLRPRAALILGSGLTDVVSGMDVAVEFPYPSLAGFPSPTVPGHPGRLVLGMHGGLPIAAFMGRIHFYEGHPMSVGTLPARLAAALGVGALVITASVGAVERSLEPGMLVVASDHINLMGENALRGWRDEEGRPAFADLSRVYDPELADVAEAAAREMGVAVARGVYAAMPGPAFETPAEIEFLRHVGATVVGMSVVPEATAAAALGLRAVGLFCVTNKTGASVDHQEVLEVASGFAPSLGRIVERVLVAL
ncbi:MAG TPA: purine-nucleoside phosphorylase [Actinomycetota bacterium]|nr:purine-nucleoside phosphorylase [Actinomycetota bacterium]